MDYSVQNEIRKVYDIPDKPPLYFSMGIRIANILHARLRQKCSSLKCDLFRCNLIASCNCDCGNYIESVDHFFLKCNISSSDNKSVSHWIMFDYSFHV